MAEQFDQKAVAKEIEKAAYDYLHGNGVDLASGNPSFSDKLIALSASQQDKMVPLADQLMADNNNWDTMPRATVAKSPWTNEITCISFEASQLDWTAKESTAGVCFTDAQARSTSLALKALADGLAGASTGSLFDLSGSMSDKSELRAHIPKL